MNYGDGRDDEIVHVAVEYGVTHANADDAASAFANQAAHDLLVENQAFEQPLHDDPPQAYPDLATPLPGDWTTAEPTVVDLRQDEAFDALLLDAAVSPTADNQPVAIEPQIPEAVLGADTGRHDDLIDNALTDALLHEPDRHDAGQSAIAHDDPAPAGPFPDDPVAAVPADPAAHDVAHDAAHADYAALPADDPVASGAIVHDPFDALLLEASIHDPATSHDGDQQVIAQHEPDERSADTALHDPFDALLLEASIIDPATSHDGEQQITAQNEPDERHADAAMHDPFDALLLEGGIIDPATHHDGDQQIAAQHDTDERLAADAVVHDALDVLLSEAHVHDPATTRHDGDQQVIAQHETDERNAEAVAAQHHGLDDLMRDVADLEALQAQLAADHERHDAEHDGRDVSAHAFEPHHDVAAAAERDDAPQREDHPALEDVYALADRHDDVPAPAHEPHGGFGELSLDADGLQHAAPASDHHERADEIQPAPTGPASADPAPVDPARSGPYKTVKGHHIHQSADYTDRPGDSRKNNPNHRNAITVEIGETQHDNASHAQLNTNRAYRGEIVRTPEIRDEHGRLLFGVTASGDGQAAPVPTPYFADAKAFYALRAAGFSRDEARRLVEESARQLESESVVPLRVPAHRHVPVEPRPEPSVIRPPAEEKDIDALMEEFCATFIDERK